MGDITTNKSWVLHPLLLEVFDAFQSLELRWSAIRLPRDFSLQGGDVDLLIDERDTGYAGQILQALGFVQLPGVGGGLQFVTYHQETRQWLWLHIVCELAFGPGYEIRTHRASGCLARRQMKGPLSVLAPDDEFWILLLHCLLNKLEVAMHHRARLVELAFVAQPAGPWGPFVNALCPKGWSPARIVACVQARDWSQLEGLPASMLEKWREWKAPPLWQRIPRRGLQLLGALRNVWRQRGISVALLGPDGAGKSSLSENLQNSFIFPVRSIYMGLTGGMLPYVDALRLPWLVIPGRFAVFWYRYLLAKYHQARGRLVVFDRYIYDAFVPHPEQLSILRRFYRWLDGHACPAPDLLLVLSASGTVMYERKGEYTPEMLEDWRQHFLALQRRFSQVEVVDTMVSTEEVCAEATEHIWQRYVERWQMKTRVVNVSNEKPVAIEPYPTQADDVSVAIATRGRPGAVLRCLDTLLEGRVRPAEVIIVDQSEDDTTARAVAERQDHDTPILYIRQKASGLSASRNAAIVATSRPILAVTDDDCVPHSNWISVIEQVFSAVDAPDAVTGRVLPLVDGSSDFHSVSLRSNTTRMNFCGKTIPWNVGTGGNFAVKHEWFERIGYYDERLGAGSPGRAAEDADLLYRLLRAGAHIRYEPDAIIYHSRQDRNRRLSTRWGYGHGIGALCSLWLRRRDMYALRMLANWLVGTSWEFVDAGLHRQWFEAYQRLWGLGGTFQGLLYGIRVYDNGRR